MQKNATFRKILVSLATLLVGIIFGLSYLGLLGVVMIKFGQMAIWVYLLLTLLAVFYVNNRKIIKEKGWLGFLQQTKDKFIVSTKSLLTLIGILSLSVLLIVLGGISLAFLGWIVASLSATTIIIISLILILFK